MNPSKKKNAAILVFVGTALAYGGFWVGAHGGSGSNASPAAAASSANVTAQKAAPATGKRILYWHDPMVPGKRFDKPGKSPFMDMQLVPVYADESDGETGVKISPTLQQNLGIRFATVHRADSPESLQLVGSTQFDESKVEVVQSRVTGYIDKLYVRSPQQQVKRGQAIASLFVPEWLAPQEEYLALKRSGDIALASGSRQRMRALSIPDSLVSAAEKTGRAQNHITLTATTAGIVTELGVRDGAMVSPGVTIAKVAGISTIWLVAEVPESLANVARPGMRVTATSAGNPQRKYVGQVREILPGVSTTTRTVQARLELDNRDGSLIPGMLMQVQLMTAKPASRLLIPTEAIINSGTRSMVFVADEHNTLRPAVVTAGRESGDDTEILSGLVEGQKVVASGQFLIDSEANLKSVMPKFDTSQSEIRTDGSSNTSSKPSKPSASQGSAPMDMPMPSPTPKPIMKPTPQGKPTTAPSYHGTGKVEEISAEAITLSHGPISALQWPAMTMDFKKPTPESFRDVKVGQTVDFSFRKGQDGYELEKVQVSGGGHK